MLKIKDISAQAQNYNAVQFTVVGNDVDHQVQVNLSKPPFAISFNGVQPNVVDLQQDDDIASEGVLSIAPGTGDVLLTVSFVDPTTRQPLPPPAKSDTSSGVLGVTGSFQYNSLI